MKNLKIITLICIMILSTACSNSYGPYSNSTIGPGEYIIGRDMPEGKYSIEIQDGIGNLSILRSNKELFKYEDLNKMYKDNDGFLDVYKLFKNDIINVDGNLKMTMKSKRVDLNNFNPLLISEDNIIHLEAGGNYISGEDFPHGYYNIRTTDPKGKLHIYNIDNESIIVDIDNDEFAFIYQNADFNDYVKITNEDFSIELIPLNLNE